MPGPSLGGSQLLWAESHRLGGRCSGGRQSGVNSARGLRWLRDWSSSPATRTLDLLIRRLGTVRSAPPETRE